MKVMMRRLRNTSRAGFTLIEIMVVVVILGILAALVAPKILGRTDEARVVAARQDIKTIMQSLKLYKLDNFHYPSTEEGIKALVERPAGAKNWREGGYLDSLPKDPWGGEYLYLKPGAHGGEIEVFSYGADGTPGGEGPDADVGSWNE